MIKLSLSQALQIKRDTRKVASFFDMSGASAGRILEEASWNEELPQEAKDALQGLADLERSRGHAVLHLLLILSTLDVNMKLLRRYEILSASELQLHLLQAAYQLSFEQSGNRLFGVMALNDAYEAHKAT